MQWYRNGSFAGTGSAKNVIIGFVPSAFKIYNPTTGCTLKWFNSLSDGTAFKDGGDCIVRATTMAAGPMELGVDIEDVVIKIDGMQYLGTADADSSAAITATTVVHSDAHAHFAAFGFSMGVNGTIDTGPDAAGNAAGYDSEAEAIAGLLAVAPATGHVLIGFITVETDAGTSFIGMTDKLTAATVNTEYYPMNNMVLTGGVTPYNGASGFGVTIGLDPHLNVSGDTLYWEAYR